MAVGKQLSTPLLSLQQDYERRMARYLTIEWRLLPASRSTEQQMIRQEESDRISAELRPGDVLVILDERGTEWNNPELARQLESWTSAQGKLVLVLGGAYGITPQLLQRARAQWSLSRLVFPHELARLLVVEQLYRSCMLQTGHPYHHA